MGLIKTYDSRKKCWHITKNAKNLKKAAAAIGREIPLGSIAVEIAKTIYLLKLKAKNFCKDDIAWVKKNI